MNDVIKDSLPVGNITLDGSHKTSVESIFLLTNKEHTISKRREELVSEEIRDRLGLSEEWLYYVVHKDDFKAKSPGGNSFAMQEVLISEDMINLDRAFYPGVLLESLTKISTGSTFPLLLVSELNHLERIEIVGSPWINPSLRGRELKAVFTKEPLENVEVATDLEFLFFSNEILSVRYSDYEIACEASKHFTELLSEVPKLIPIIQKESPIAFYELCKVQTVGRLRDFGIYPNTEDDFLLFDFSSIRKPAVVETLATIVYLLHQDEYDRLQIEALKKTLEQYLLRVVV